jgi:hypothetical protein
MTRSFSPHYKDDNIKLLPGTTHAENFQVKVEVKVKENL